MIVLYGITYEIAWRTFTLLKGLTFAFIPRKTTNRLGWSTIWTFGLLCSALMAFSGRVKAVATAPLSSSESRLDAFVITLKMIVWIFGFGPYQFGFTVRTYWFPGCQLWR